MSSDSHAPGYALEGVLPWLPERADWQESLVRAKSLDPAAALEACRTLARSRMDFARTVKLDRTVQQLLSLSHNVAPASLTRVRLAFLGSSTLTHLIPGIRIAGLRRGLLVDVYEAPYGAYRQELADRSSGLYAFAPTVVLFALDAHHLAGPGHASAADAPAARALDAMQTCWRMAREAFSCAVVQQAVLPVFPPLLGNNEYRLAGSPFSAVEAINAALRERASAQSVVILSLDVFAREDGIRPWYDDGLWHRAKQEVHPRMSPAYGDQVARILATLTGRSSKCLVLDLDHTLWGGGIGDDGLESIELGQGSAAGEARVAFQHYIKGLMERGVVLAVCSKNDEANALLPFERHPEMVLRRSDIACFVANWDDKATNLRRIARTLNLGLDSLVFVDDNPAERGLVRRELPMVEVPEMPEDPADYIRVLSGAGYFEALCVTEEDRNRASLYASIEAREAGRRAVQQSVRREAGKGANVADSANDEETDLASYLAGLRMELHWRPFDTQGRARIVQLINKTNQFNLTTKRCVDADLDRALARKDILGLQFRLKDTFGDNGMIAVLQCEPASGSASTASADLEITHWLMSCRVLGRQVEHAMMNVLAEQARQRGFRRILGRYLPTPKNAMVRDHYGKMGFALLETAPDGASLWVLDLVHYQAFPTQIACVESELAAV